MTALIVSFICCKFSSASTEPTLIAKARSSFGIFGNSFKILSVIFFGQVLGSGTGQTAISGLYVTKTSISSTSTSGPTIAGTIVTLFALSGFAASTIYPRPFVDFLSMKMTSTFRLPGLEDAFSNKF